MRTGTSLTLLLILCIRIQIFQKQIFILYCVGAEGIIESAEFCHNNLFQNRRKNISTNSLDVLVNIHFTRSRWSYVCCVCLINTHSIHKTFFSILFEDIFVFFDLVLYCRILSKDFCDCFLMSQTNQSVTTYVVIESDKSRLTKKHYSNKYGCY